MLSGPLCLETWTSPLVLSVSPGVTTQGLPEAQTALLAMASLELAFYSDEANAMTQKHEASLWVFSCTTRSSAFIPMGSKQSSSKPHKAKSTPFGHGFDVVSPWATQLQAAAFPQFSKASAERSLIRKSPPNHSVGELAAGEKMQRQQQIPVQNLFILKRAGIFMGLRKLSCHRNFSGWLVLLKLVVAVGVLWLARRVRL